MAASVFVAAGSLVVLAGLFAMVDAAITTVSPARAAELAREKVRGAATLHLIAKDAARYTNLLLLLRLICELLATTLVALVAIEAITDRVLAVAVVVAAMTVISFVAVGVAPRTIGRQHAYTVGRWCAPVVHSLGRAFGPLPSLLILIGNAVTPGKGFRHGPFAGQVELREFVDMAEMRGVVEHDERDMIHSVVSLGHTIAREVMVPRPDMVWIEGSKTARSALALALRSGFSRLPVIGESVDDVLGVVYLKDLVQRLRDAPEPDSLSVKSVMRQASYVPESKHVDDLLREMQAARTHMAIVVDEYGGTAGLITIEDILEEIVGEITDEYDVEHKPVEELPDGRKRVTARLPVEDLGELFGVTLDANEVETVGGLLAKALGRVPIPGAEVSFGGLLLKADGTSGRRNRIDTVVVSLAGAPQRTDHREVAASHDVPRAPDGYNAQSGQRRHADV